MVIFPLEEEKFAVPLFQFLVPEILTTLWLLSRHLQLQMEVYLMKFIIPIAIPAFLDE